MLDGRQLIRRSGTVLVAPASDDLVMLDPERGSYFALDPVARHIWDLLGEPATFEEVYRGVMDTYEVDAEECKTAVSAFLEELASLGLVEY